VHRLNKNNYLSMSNNGPLDARASDLDGNVRSDFLVFGAPAIEESDIEEVVHSMRSGWLGTGPKVAKFERDFRRYKGDWGYPVAVNSCTAALHLAMIAANLEPGDEVITSALTFCATANAIVHAGGTPVVVDVDPDTMNIDPNAIRRAITPRTKAVIPIHFAGLACQMDEIVDIARDHDLLIIEDCAHAIETTFEGRPAGTFGEYGCFSFYVTKNVVTGEGGMVLARTEENAGRIKTLALHGMSKDAWKRFSDEGYKHYDVVESGFKYNMMDIQAAIGIHQLERVEANWLRRQQIWDRYQEAFGGAAVGTPADAPTGSKHGLHLYTLLVDRDSIGMTRDEFLGHMTKRNIGVGVHYRSLCEYKYYQDRFGWRTEHSPHATDIGRRTVSLPLTAKMTDDDVEYVIDAVEGVLIR